MGATQSGPTRSVSMENPNPIGVLDISDDVVNRLKKGITKQVREKAKASESKPQEKEQPKKEKPKPVVKPPVPTLPPPAPTIIYQNSPTIPVAVATTVTASDVRRQMEVELQKNDGLWRDRMANLEETLKKTNSIMEEEYSTAVENVRSRFANAPPTHQLPPCQDLKAQLLACYRAHPGETLLCSEEVAMFRDCVNAHRLKKLDKNEETSTTKIAKAG